MRVFENKVLKKIFGPEKGSFIICTVPQMFQSKLDEMRNVYKASVAKPERKRPLGRPRCRREDNIKVNLREIRLEGVDWILLPPVRDRLLDLVTR